MTVTLMAFDKQSKPFLLLRNPANKQTTNKRTNADENITSLAVVTISRCSLVQEGLQQGP